MVETVLNSADDLKPPFAPRAIPPTAPNAQTTASQPSSGNVGATTGQQPVLDTATNIPLTDLDSLPTIVGKGSRRHPIVLANNAIPQFLAETLNLERLNKIHGLLWMAGRPMRARPLHRYKMMGFNVLPTQQMDLHLLKFSNNMLLKPLPEWIFSHDFWTKYLCHKSDLHASACGFLLSYIWLITTPIDLKLAHDASLLPSFITWHWWKDFVTEFYNNVDINALHQVNPRYQFGELRLSRINSIYRIRYFHTNFIRGYLYGYNRYAVFFQRNFSWILSVFVLFSLVLSAMQVGTSLAELQGNRVFLRGSYGFVVLSMVCVGAVLAVLVTVFAGIFLYNMGAAIGHVRRMEGERGKKVAELGAGKEGNGASC
ncbi:hypothetical protein NX059_000022 [Plenodomus lindquistii]|nr:hypothetical protein NX059_000022 [Plenodomus lindquistii]